MFRNLKRLERRKKPYPSINQWCDLSKIRDGLDTLEGAADLKTNLKKFHCKFLNAEVAFSKCVYVVTC